MSGGKKKLKSGKRIFRPRWLVVTFLGVAFLMTLSAVIEMDQTEKEFRTLMEEQAHSLFEAMLVASQNTLRANNYIETLVRQRLFDNANLVKYLYEHGEVTDSLLGRIASENDVYRINIYNREGRKIFSSHKQDHTDLPEKHSPAFYLGPIFSGKTDSLAIGLKSARFLEGYRYAVAFGARNRSAIVLNLDAEQLLEFRRQIGYGRLLREIVKSPGIIFAALQDTSGILAASGNVGELERIDDSPFLKRALRDSSLSARVIDFDSTRVFEAVHPFDNDGQRVGLFIMGLSVQPLDTMNARQHRRLIIMSLVLAFAGVVIFTFIMVRQNLDVLKKQYNVVETYSGNIIKRVSDAIVTFSMQEGIKIFNDAAGNLFATSNGEVAGKSISILFGDTNCESLLGTAGTMQQIDCVIAGEPKRLLVSKSSFPDEKGVENHILVIRDMTDLRRLESQVERAERLTAMGELASGVAHEIRNPLNTIATIIQQLSRDFEPKENAEEHRELTALIYQEVKRINETVSDFLRFARPERARPEKFMLSDFLGKVIRQYSALAAERNVRLDIARDWDGEVYWDPRQMQQVFVNLVQNAMDAVESGGQISIAVRKSGLSEVDIHVIDNGKGIPDKLKSRIFNLYFTTKPKGTGVGLSIVQKIILEHGGVISFESKEGNGTTFILKMPLEAYPPEINPVSEA